MLHGFVAWFTRVAKVVTRPQLLVILIAVLLVSTSLGLSQPPVANRNNKIAVTPAQHTVVSPIKNTASTPATPATTVTSPTTTTKSAPTTPTSSALDFTLSTANVSMSPGETTPTITATTTNGAVVSWLVVAPPAGQSYMLIKSGIVGYGESAHSFTIGSNPTETAPGTYTATITAYYSSTGVNAGVTKNVTITIVPGATFQIVPYSGASVSGTDSETCAPFTVDWTLPSGTTTLPLTFTTRITSSIASGADTISGVQLNGNTGCVMINTNTIVQGGVSISIYATDGVYSSSSILNYDLN